MASKVRVYGKAMGWTALGIIDAYLKMYPHTTLEDLNKAFPRKEFVGPNDKFDNLLDTVDNLEKAAAATEKTFDDDAVADMKRTHWYVMLQDGTAVGFKNIMWTKNNFPKIVEYAKVYDIEIAEFTEADKGSGKRGSYKLEYLNGYVPTVPEEDDNNAEIQESYQTEQDEDWDENEYIEEGDQPDEVFNNALNVIMDAMQNAGLKRLGLYGSDNVWQFECDEEISEEYSDEIEELDGGDSGMDMYTFNQLHGDWAERWCELSAISIDGDNMLFSWKWMEYTVSGDCEEVLEESDDDNLSLIWRFATRYKSDDEAKKNLGKVFKTIIENLDLLIKLTQAANKLKDAGQWEE